MHTYIQRGYYEVSSMQATPKQKEPDYQHLHYSNKMELGDSDEEWFGHAFVVLVMFLWRIKFVSGATQRHQTDGNAGNRKT